MVNALLKNLREEEGGGGEERRKERKIEREKKRSEDRRRRDRITTCTLVKGLQIELTASIRGRRFANRCRRELLSRNTMNDVDALNASLDT